MLFGAYETWAHASAPDIALLVLRVTYRGPVYWKVKGRLVNRHNPEIHYETRTYRIQRKHFRFWGPV